MDLGDYGGSTRSLRSLAHHRTEQGPAAFLRKQEAGSRRSRVLRVSGNEDNGDVRILLD